MKKYKLLKNISTIAIVGVFIITIQKFFFRDKVTEAFNNVTLYVLLALLIIFVVVEILKKKI